MEEQVDFLLMNVQGLHKMTFVCPVCFFTNLPYPPENYNICPCCGTEFENDDVEYTYAELRRAWIARGAPWFYGAPDPSWSAWAQLAECSYGITTGAKPATVGNYSKCDESCFMVSVA